MRRPVILHPFLLGLYFVLIGIASFHRLSWQDIFIPLVIVSAGIAALYGFALLLNKDRVKSGVITTIVLVPLLFYIPIFLFFLYNMRTLAHHKFIMPGLFISAAIFIWLTAKTRRRLLYLNAYLNILAAIYVLYGITLVAMGMNKPYERHHIEIPKFDYRVNAASPRAAAKLPDIYYIILDSYTSSYALKMYWDYDNSDFVESLKKRGFYIAEKSKSFYESTAISMASTLNMTDDENLKKLESGDLDELIGDSAVVKYLQSRSYDIINLSLFDLPGSRRFFSAFLYKAVPGQFNIQIFNRFLGYVIAEEVMRLNYPEVNAKIISILEEIPDARKDRPRFVYAHLMTPHKPFCLDRHSNIIPWSERNKPDEEAYLDQLIGTNKIIMKVIDAIMTKSSVAPIIIIQGDHGYKPAIVKGERSDRAPVDILNAFRLPYGGNADLYESISPFNTFRVIFKRYFNEKLGLLGDQGRKFT